MQKGFMKNNSVTSFATFILFVTLIFFGAVLTYSLSRDVSLESMPSQSFEGNIHVQSFESHKTISYRWFYQGLQTITLSIPHSLYYEYAFLERSFSKEYSYYTSKDNPILDALAREIKRISNQRRFNELQEAALVISFIHNFKGTPDFFDDYPKFPLETVYLATGDCEDMAILAAAILKRLDYDVIFIEFDSHVGIAIAFSQDFFLKNYIFYNGKRYFYAEVTGFGHSIGEMPPQYKDKPFKIFDPSLPVLDPKWSFEKIRSVNETSYNIDLSFIRPVSGEIIVTIQYEDEEKNKRKLFTFEKEERTTMMLPVLPSLRHRLTIDISGEGINPVVLRTDWIVQEP